LINKKPGKLCQAYSATDIESVERMQFVPGWIDFPLNNGGRLEIMTSMKGLMSP
jgi:hypothetical protein